MSDADEKLREVDWTVLTILRCHRYEYGNKGAKPDDPGWHACTCGWEGYWCDFGPHVARHVAEPLAAVEAQNAELRAVTERLIDRIQQREVATAAGRDQALQALQRTRSEALRWVERELGIEEADRLGHFLPAIDPALAGPVGVPAEQLEPRKPKTAPTKEDVLAYLALAPDDIDGAIDYALSYADAYEIPRWDADRIVIENGWLAGRCGRCGEELPGEAPVAEPLVADPMDER